MGVVPEKFGGASRLILAPGASYRVDVALSPERKELIVIWTSDRKHDSANFSFITSCLFNSE